MPLEQFTIQEGFAQPLSLTEPNNVFALQNKLSNELNSYQTKYARYMRCNDPNTNNEVTDPKCDLDTTDSFTSLNIAYRSLSSTMDELSDVYQKQTTEGAKTPAEYETDAKQIPVEYQNLIELRSKLDTQLAFLQKQLETNGGEPQRRLQSRQLINTLLIIGVFSILYYILIGMD